MCANGFATDAGMVYGPGATSATFRTGPGGAMSTVDVIFRARPAAGADPDAAAPGSPEIVEARWFDPNGLPELQHETSAAFVALARADR